MNSERASTEDSFELDYAAARGRLFRCFAEAFSSPTDGLLERLFSDALQNELVSLGEYLPYAVRFESPRLLPEGMSRQDVRVFFSSCFESGRQGASLRESAYSTRPEKSLLEDVLRFYQHFGLELSGGGLREAPDNLAVELEFLHYLCFLQTCHLENRHLEKESPRGSSPDHNLTALRRAEQDFLDRHIVVWVRSFMLKLKEMPDNGLYANLADLLAGFVEAERSYGSCTS